MKIKTKIVLPHIYLITYPTQYELCMSFVRIQEFYESPKFRGKYFTLEDYIDYWSLTKGKGSFTYPVTWSGFNVPGDVIENWRIACEEHGDTLRERESDLLFEIDNLMYKDGLRDISSDDINKIYVIGAYSGSSNVDQIDQIINHESAHAFYRLYPEYKKSCDKILKKISSDEMDKMKDTLLIMGYCKKVLPDEIQAYSSVPHGLLTNGFINEFKENYNNFKNKLIEES